MTRDGILKCLAILLTLTFVPLDAIAQRYAPGCLREQYYMDETYSRLNSGQIVGLEIIAPGQIGDPRFSDGNWSKYADARIDRYPVGSPQDPIRTIRRFRIEIHYMRNRVTGEIADFKLVNSVQDGCDGYEQPAWAPGGDQLAEGYYSIPQGMAYNWFAAPSWPESLGTVIIGDITPVHVTPMGGGGGGGICHRGQCGDPILQ